MKQITVRYFAMFRENAGMAEESISTAAVTAADVFLETQPRHGSGEPTGHCKVAINEVMANCESPVSDGDTVLLFPPVAGG